MPVLSLPNINSSYRLVAVEETPGLGKHPLFSRAKRRESYTVWITGRVVNASTYPMTDDLKAADAVYSGGSDHIVSGAVAQQIYNAGYGSWLTEVTP